MKAYVITTGCIFALIVAAHVWRIAAENAHLASDSFYIAITALAAALSAWAAVLVIRPRPR